MIGARGDGRRQQGQQVQRSPSFRPLRLSEVRVVIVVVLEACSCGRAARRRASTGGAAAVVAPLVEARAPAARRLLARTFLALHELLVLQVVQK